MDGSTPHQTAPEALTQAAAKPHSEVVFQVSEATLRPPRPTWFDIANTVIGFGSVFASLIVAIYTCRASKAARDSAKAAKETQEEMKAARDEERISKAPEMLAKWIIVFNKHKLENEVFPQDIDIVLTNTRGESLKRLEYSAYILNQEFEIIGKSENNIRCGGTHIGREIYIGIGLPPGMVRVMENEGTIYIYIECSAVDHLNNRTNNHQELAYKATRNDKNITTTKREVMRPGTITREEDFSKIKERIYEIKVK